MRSDLLSKLLELKMTLVDELIESLPAEKQERIKEIERDIIKTVVSAGQAYLDKMDAPTSKESDATMVKPIKVE